MAKVLRPVPTFEQVVRQPVQQLDKPERIISVSKPDPTLPPGCPEGSWRFARFGALSLNWLDLFGKRAKRLGGLGKHQGAGP